jgi:hypothetical protein
MSARRLLRLMIGMLVLTSGSVAGAPSPSPARPGSRSAARQTGTGCPLRAPRECRCSALTSTSELT